MQVEEARAILGDAAIIGVSAHNVEEALLAENRVLITLVPDLPL